MFAGGEAEPDEEVGLAGAGVAEQNDRIAGADVAASGEGGDHSRFDGGGGVKVEVSEPFDAWELGVVDAAGSAAFGAGVDFGFEDLGEEPEVGQLGSLGVGGEPGCVGAHDGRRLGSRRPRRCR